MKNKKRIGILCILVVICLFLFGIYCMLNKSSSAIELKNNKDIVLEYGKKVDLKVKDLVKTNDLDQDELKEVKIKTNIKNEKDKDYPKVGKYKITITYDDEKLNKKLIIKDTTKPVFNEVNEVNVVVNSKTIDYSTVQATDLSPVKITYDDKTVDKTKAGKYTVKATAKDDYGNEVTKELTVNVTNAQTSSNGSVTNSGGYLDGSTLTGTSYGSGSKVVCIDAGHQGRGNSSKEPNGPGSSVMKAKVTSGASGVSSRTPESVINLQVAMRLKNILVSRGYRVVMCRESQNVNISNAERAVIANNNKAQAFVRIHCDSSTSSGSTGTMTMAPSNSNRYCSSIASQSQALSRSILNATCAKTGWKSRGVSITDSMTGLNWSKVPVTIIEMGFLSNPNEDRMLNSEEYQNKLANGIADGLDDYLK